MNNKEIDASQLRQELSLKNEWAIIDIREAKYYAQGHINLSAHISLSYLELSVLQSLPRQSVPVVIVSQNGGDAAQRAAAQLSRLGYSNVRILTGGISAWLANGYPVGTGYNTLVKTFSDLAHAHYQTPTITPAELQNRLASGQPTTIIDCRPEQEHRNLSIKGAHNAPGVELALYELQQQDAGHLYVISCFSRTRGIVGTTTLARLNHLTNVAFLEDGIMAAFLHGVPTGPGDPQLAIPAAQASDTALRQASEKIIADYGLQPIDGEDYQRFLDEREQRTLYVFDIRPAAAYQQGHLAEAVHVPGGQLLMNFDAHVPVRNARIVLVDDSHAKRGAVSAFWLSHFNHAEIYILALDATQHHLTSAPAATPALPQDVRWLEPHQVAQRLEQGIALFDVGPSLFYENAHIPQAQFILRASLSAHFKAQGIPAAIVFTSPDGSNAAYAAADISREFGIETYALKGGTDAWQRAGLPVTDQFTPQQLLSPFDDDWGSTMRAKVNREQKFRDYLAWERSLGHLIPQDDSVQFYWPSIANV